MAGLLFRSKSGWVLGNENSLLLQSVLHSLAVGTVFPGLCLLPYKWHMVAVHTS